LSAAPCFLPHSCLTPTPCFLPHSCLTPTPCFLPHSCLTPTPCFLPHSSLTPTPCFLPHSSSFFSGLVLSQVSWPLSFVADAPEAVAAWHEDEILKDKMQGWGGIKRSDTSFMEATPISRPGTTSFLAYRKTNGLADVLLATRTPYTHTHTHISRHDTHIYTPTQHTHQDRHR